MNELDNGQQEQYSEPKKKKNTQKIVKRTLYGAQNETYIEGWEEKI